MGSGIGKILAARNPLDSLKDDFARRSDDPAHSLSFGIRNNHNSDILFYLFQNRERVAKTPNDGRIASNV
jgi:hypothetical protein